MPKRNGVFGFNPLSGAMDTEDPITAAIGHDPEGSCMTLILTCVLLTVLFAVGVYDIAVMLWGPQNEMVSWHIYTLCKAHPIIAILIGMVLGHLFAPLIVTK